MKRCGARGVKVPEAAGELLQLLLYFDTSRSGCRNRDAEPALEEQAVSNLNRNRQVGVSRRKPLWES
jgi:hypothetical protein